jgi:alpha-tubulin suppressor-like RCC1 family protein
MIMKVICIKNEAFLLNVSVLAPRKMFKHLRFLILAFCMFSVLVCIAQTSGYAVTPTCVSGNYGSFALKEDGTLWSLTDGASQEVLTNVKAITTGELRLFAIKNDGSLWGIGNNAFGSLGDGTNVDKVSFVQVLNLTSDVLAVASGRWTTYALKTDGSLWMFGVNNGWVSSTPTLKLNAGSGFIDVVAGNEGNDRQSIALLKNDGTVFVLGCGGRGQYGNGTVGTADIWNVGTLPIQVSITDVIDIAAGQFFIWL